MLSKSFKASLNLSDFNDNIREILSEYSCPLCEGILNNAVLDKCGHSYCLSCINELVKLNKPCPFTNKVININDIYNNTIVNSFIEKQNIKCPNSNHSCTWTGKLSSRKNHLENECFKEELTCKNSCGFRGYRSDMNNHNQLCMLKLVNCEYCDENIVLKDIEIHYNDHCKSFPIKCACGSNVPKDRLEFHVNNECPNTIMECPFRSINCCSYDFKDINKTNKSSEVNSYDLNLSKDNLDHNIYKAKKIDIDKHLESSLNYHLNGLTSKIKELSNVIKDQSNTISLLKSKHNMLELEINNINYNNDKKLEENFSKINDLNNLIDNLKNYNIIPLSNIKPSFEYYVNNNNISSQNINLNNSFNDCLEKCKVFEFNSNTIVRNNIEDSKWFGICSSEIINEKNDSIIIINMKIIHTSNSCIMLGITFCNKFDILNKGFYNNIDIESYMLYCYNKNIYKNGVLFYNYLEDKSNKLKQTKSCVDGDILSLYINLSKNEINFRLNGNIIIDSIPVIELSIPEKLNNLRVCLDMSDSLDTISFI